MGRLLNGKEKKLFDRTSVEILSLAGADDPILWKFVAHVPGQADIDCLYKEPVEGSKHYFAYKVMCHFEEPEHSANSTDDGLETRLDGRVWFARKNLEDVKVPANTFGEHVSVGDIIQLFSKSIKTTWSFDILNVARSQFEHNSDVWTHYVCDVARNYSFTPERKIVK